jgi:G patch domain-containing protein 1
LDRSYAFDTGNDDEDVIVMGGPSRPVAGGKQDQRAREPLNDVDRWHDGRPVLSGFELDPLGVPPDKW